MSITTRELVSVTSHGPEDFFTALADLHPETAERVSAEDVRAIVETSVALALEATLRGLADRHMDKVVLAWQDL